MFVGKAELFIKRWESSITPKLRKIAALEKGVVSLLDEAGDQNDGTQFTYYECFAPSFCVNIIGQTFYVFQIDEVCYRTLQILTHLLPPTASGRGSSSTRCSVKSVITYLINFVPVCCVREFQM